MKIIMHFNYIKIAKADTSCNEENKSISEKSRRNNFTFFQFATLTRSLNTIGIYPIDS